MTCDRVEMLLSAYVDRELPSEEMFAVRAHLVDCAGCAQRERQTRAIHRLVADLPNVEPSADFEARLVHSVMSGASLERKRPRFGSAVAFFAVAACVMALTLGVLRLGNRTVATPAGPDITFEVQRDQISAFGADPTQGSFVVPANYGAR